MPRVIAKIIYIFMLGSHAYGACKLIRLSTEEDEIQPPSFDGGPFRRAEKRQYLTSLIVAYL